MTIFINIADNYVPLVTPALVERSAMIALEHQGILPKTDLTIFITSDSDIQQLNLQYRNIDAPTDVLAFPAEFTDPESGHRYLGDIIISYERAGDQAQSSQHPLEDELRLLIVHGVLHLLGYDHDQIDQQDEMWSAQYQILELLGANAVKRD